MEANFHRMRAAIPLGFRILRRLARFKLDQVRELKPMRWRIIRNKWNLKGAPWHGAVGIEEDDDVVAVPGIVCWFTRGWEQPALAQSVVDAHNAAIKIEYV